MFGSFNKKLYLCSGKTGKERLVPHPVVSTIKKRAILTDCTFQYNYFKIQE